MLAWGLNVAALGRTRSYFVRRWDESLFGEEKDNYTSPEEGRGLKDIRSGEIRGYKLFVWNV